jgi:hypothetical protein
MMPKYEVICRLRDTNDHYLRRIDAKDLFQVEDICAEENLIPVTLVSVDGTGKGNGGQVLPCGSTPIRLEIEFPGPKYWKATVRATWADPRTHEEHTQRFEFDRSCNCWRSGQTIEKERIASRLARSTDFLDGVEATLRAIAAHEETPASGRR